MTNMYSNIDWLFQENHIYTISWLENSLKERIERARTEGRTRLIRHMKNEPYYIAAQILNDLDYLSTRECHKILDYIEDIKKENE